MEALKVGKTKYLNKLNKDEAKERLHLVLLQDRANVSADFLDMMKQEIIEVIKKYIDIDEKEMDVKLTNKQNSDGTTGAPALYANIPIVGIKSETRKKTNKIKLKEMDNNTQSNKDDKNSKKKVDKSNSKTQKGDKKLAKSTEKTENKEDKIDKEDNKKQDKSQDKNQDKNQAKVQDKDQDVKKADKKEDTKLQKENDEKKNNKKS